MDKEVADTLASLTAHSMYHTNLLGALIVAATSSGAVSPIAVKECLDMFSVGMDEAQGALLLAASPVVAETQRLMLAQIKALDKIAESWNPAAPAAAPIVMQDMPEARGQLVALSGMLDQVVFLIASQWPSLAGELAERFGAIAATAGKSAMEETDQTAGAIAAYAEVRAKRTIARLAALMGAMAPGKPASH